MIVWSLDREYQEVSERCGSFVWSLCHHSLEYYDLANVSVLMVAIYRATVAVTFTIDIGQVSVL